MQRGSMINIDFSKANQKSTKAKGAENKKEINYAIPDKPLDFSFKDVRVLEDLIPLQPRSGTRKLLETPKETQSDNNNNNLIDKVNTSNFDEEISTNKRSHRKENKGETTELIEAKMHIGENAFHSEKTINKMSQKEMNINVLNNKDLNTQNNLNKDVPKKTVKYLKYSNTVILHSNYIKSLKNIHIVFDEILPEISFIKSDITKSKIDLIQWLDISHNRLEEIHPDILKLPFLKILYCHANYIKEIEKVSCLSQSKSLLNLTLHGNPIEQIKGYRHFIIELIPFLEKLDFTLISEKELDIIKHKGSRYGEKRKKGVVIEYPKLDEEILKRMALPKDEEEFERKEEF